MTDQLVFAAKWIAAWNAHDLDRILSHYTDDVVFLSPVAERVTGDGRVEGKDALRAYWATAFERNPGLHFTLTRVYRGAGALTILYENQAGKSVTETVVLDDEGRVSFSAACYAD